MLTAIVIFGIVMMSLSLVGHLAMSDTWRLFRAMHRRVIGTDFDMRRLPTKPSWSLLFVALTAPLIGAYALLTMNRPRRIVSLGALGVAKHLSRDRFLPAVHAAAIMVAIAGWGDLNIHVVITMPAPTDEDEE